MLQLSILCLVTITELKLLKCFPYRHQLFTKIITIIIVIIDIIVVATSSIQTGNQFGAFYNSTFKLSFVDFYNCVFTCLIAVQFLEKQQSLPLRLYNLYNTFYGINMLIKRDLAFLITYYIDFTSYMNGLIQNIYYSIFYRVIDIYIMCKT